jgi:hypothetical protein
MNRTRDLLCIGTMRRLAHAVLVTLMALVAVSGCVAPTTDSGAYRQNAAAAIRSALGEARTGALAVQARLDAKVTNAYVDTVVTQSESALGPIEDSFGSVDPPSRRDDDLRDHVGTMLSDTADALSTARIAVRREDRAGMRASVRELARLGDQLDQAQQALS